MHTYFFDMCVPFASVEWYLVVNEVSMSVISWTNANGWESQFGVILEAFIGFSLVFREEELNE